MKMSLALAAVGARGAAMAGMPGAFVLYFQRNGREGGGQFLLDGGGDAHSQGTSLGRCECQAIRFLVFYAFNPIIPSWPPRVLPVSKATSGSSRKRRASRSRKPG